MTASWSRPRCCLPTPPPLSPSPGPTRSRRSLTCMRRGSSSLGVWQGLGQAAGQQGRAQGRSCGKGGRRPKPHHPGPQTPPPRMGRRTMRALASSGQHCSPGSSCQTSSVCTCWCVPRGAACLAPTRLWALRWACSGGCTLFGPVRGLLGVAVGHAQVGAGCAGACPSLVAVLFGGLSRH